MRAVHYLRYGSPDVLELVETDTPVPADDEVLVRVRAASVNPADWYGMTGLPVARFGSGLRAPKDPRLGVDFAGIVEAIGKNVTHVAPGDEVYGGRTGAFAEYVSVKNAVARMPERLSFEQAAAVPVAAITALQGLRDKARLEPGERVLVHGASGGVGTFAVQIAKALGAGHVTAVCSTRNVEQARSLGADRVVDYAKEDVARCGERFDVLLQVGGAPSYGSYRRISAPGARLVIVGAVKDSSPLGPLAYVLKTKLASLGRSPHVSFFVAKLTRDDLEVLNEMLEGGAVMPVVERTYELSEIAEAMRHLGEGHARGKIVITV